MTNVTRNPGFVVRGSQIENRVSKAFVFNESGADVDFRIEGDTAQNLFYTDAGNDRVGINTPAPLSTLDVVGTFRFRDAETPTKSFRYRFGGATDVEGAGADLYYSVWSNADFTGTQYTAFVLKSNGDGIQFRYKAIFNDESGDIDTIIRGDNDGTLFYADASVDAVGIGKATPLAKLHVHQSSAAGAKPVITMDQADVSEEFIRFIGESATDNSQSLVDAADLPTPGSIVGWFKIYVEDVRGTDSITDGVYYVPFYSTPTA